MLGKELEGLKSEGNKSAPITRVLQSKSSTVFQNLYFRIRSANLELQILKSSFRTSTTTYSRQTSGVLFRSHIERSVARIVELHLFGLTVYYKTFDSKPLEAFSELFATFPELITNS